MSGQSNKKTGAAAMGIFFIALACFTGMYFAPAPAFAQQSVILQPIPFTPSQRGYGMRMHPIHKSMRMHGGQDYPTPTGTNIPFTGTIIECKPNNGAAGNMAVVGNACDVKQVYMHLARCSTTDITSGNTGGSTGAHLHYEVHIAGTRVDPMKAFGKDLCKAENRKMLLDDAKNNGQGSGGGAAADSNSPEPTQPGGMNRSVIYIPPGGQLPGGGINTGPGFYIIETYDGRIITEVEMESTDLETPLLPPTTEDVVPTGETDNEVTGCATDTWTAMVNQAVLQTRREVLMNHRYILKADTVMAYSCFEQSLKKMGEHGGVFSETKLWVNRQVDISSGDNVGSLGPGKIEKEVTLNKEIGETSLDGAIQNNASSVFSSYARSNFKHGILGGLYEKTSGGMIDDEDIGQDALPCGTMADIWVAAKCLNMDDDPMFPTFQQLIDNKNDPRKYPANMSCNNTGITQNMIDIARNKKVDNSKLDPYIKLLHPVGACAPPVYTGITVERNEGPDRISRKVTYQDGVCLTSGCTFQRGGTCR